MTKQAARSIFGAVRDRDTFDSRIPRASSTTAAPTWVATFGPPLWVIRPLTAAEYTSVVAADNRAGECGNSTTGSLRLQRLKCAGPAERVRDDLHLPAAARCADGVFHLGDGHPI